jgi:hypothetical protein
MRGLVSVETLSLVHGIFHALAFIGMIVAAYDFYVHRRPASLVWGLVFLVGWSLPRYAGYLLLGLKTPLVRFLIPNNPAGMAVSAALLAAPWLYFLPRIFRRPRKQKD